MSRADRDSTVRGQNRGAGKPHNAISGDRMTHRSANYSQRTGGPYGPAETRSGIALSTANLHVTQKSRIELNAADSSNHRGVIT